MSWPAWATENAEIRSADAAWQQQGDELREALEAALKPWLVGSVEHVGSTAVPGLAAKPIIDVQAAIIDLRHAPSIARVLAPAGWNYVRPSLDRRPWRRFLVQVHAGRRAAHLHLMTPGTARWDQQLAFRDALLADPELAHAYAMLKHDLSRRHPEDREAYSTAKADFIRAAISSR
jgi:GrpB-like predicted nucleotidyltransferase (UPF0157 family)